MSHATVVKMPKRCSKESFARRQAIAKSLTALRMKAGLTMVDASAKAGIGLYTWMRWEAARGSIPLERMADIREALDADLITAIRPHLCAA